MKMEHRLSGYHRLRTGWRGKVSGCGYEGELGYKNVLHLDFYPCQHPACDTLPVLLDVATGKNWVKSTGNVSVSFLTTVYEIYYYLKIKSLLKK